MLSWCANARAGWRPGGLLARRGVWGRVVVAGSVVADGGLRPRFLGACGPLGGAGVGWLPSTLLGCGVGFLLACGGGRSGCVGAGCVGWVGRGVAAYCGGAFSASVRLRLHCGCGVGFLLAWGWLLPGGWVGLLWGRGGGSCLGGGLGCCGVVAGLLGVGCLWGGGLWWLLGLGVFCFVLFFVFWCVFVVVCLFWGWLVGWWWGCLLCGVVRGCGLLFGGWLVCGWVALLGFGLCGCLVVVLVVVCRLGFRRVCVGSVGGMAWGVVLVARLFVRGLCSCWCSFRLLCSGCVGVGGVGLGWGWCWCMVVGLGGVCWGLRVFC